MKKVIVALLLGLSLLAGCGQDEKKSTPEQTQGESAPAAPANPTEKPAQ